MGALLDIMKELGIDEDLNNLVNLHDRYCSAWEYAESMFKSRDTLDELIFEGSIDMLKALNEANYAFIFFLELATQNSF